MTRRLLFIDEPDDDGLEDVLDALEALGLVGESDPTPAELGS